MWGVVVVHSFNNYSPMIIVGDLTYAKAYLHWLWEDYYNTQLAEGAELNEKECFHEESYAKITWDNGDYTEFILTYDVEVDPRFREADWKKYL